MEKLKSKPNIFLQKYLSKMILISHLLTKGKKSCLPQCYLKCRNIWILNAKDFSGYLCRKSFIVIMMAKVTQCGKMTIFLPLAFYLKSFFDDFKGSKTAILTILEALNVEFGKFLNFLKAEIYQNQKSRASKTGKMADLNFEINAFTSK